MITEYVFRGKIIYEFETGKESELPVTLIPTVLPMSLEQFRIDICPNREAYLDTVFEGDTEREVDNDYPLSLLYLDVKASEERATLRRADESMRNLEAMFRLYQKGGVYIRRHFQTWKIINGNASEVMFLNFDAKPPEPNLYSLGGYAMDDESFVGFSKFFDRFWHVVNRKREPIYHAVLRFSSSYEKSTLADRLIDLMIALEALFNESADSIAYKVSLRCSSLIGASDREKWDYFKKLRRLYMDRNAIVHGDKKGIEKDKTRVDSLEEIVRKAIIKFLELDIGDFPVNSLDAIDDLLFFHGISRQEPQLEAGDSH